jgi:uracil-DNA glycosylase
MNFDHIISSNWKDIINSIDKDILEITIDNFIKKCHNKNNVFPKENNIFSFTKYCLFDELKVVILGQDPYHGVYKDNQNIYKPQATGLAFSVPKECPIPPSLKNIYQNQLKFKRINFIPNHGCLDYLAYQGVLLLNTSLTVEKSKPNSHQSIWNIFTDELIKIISEKHSNLVFVLWGNNAFSKLNLIKNKSNHKIIISSHPSPLSCHSKLGQYNSFMETDHFGIINEFLEKSNKYIDWQIV